MESILIISDLDDTLCTHNSSIPEADVRRLNGMIDCHKLRFTFATARDIVDFMKLDLNLEMNLPAILCNGRLIYDMKRNQIITYYPFDLTIETSVMNQIKQQNLVIHAVGVVDGKVIRETINDNTRSQIRGKILSLSAIVSENVISSIYQTLQEEFKENLEIRVYDYPYIKSHKVLDLQSKIYNKGVALQYLRDQNPSIQRVICFGNGTDDISMFEHSDYRVAVGDCPKELLELSHRHIPFSNVSVIDEIENILMGENKLW